MDEREKRKLYFFNGRRKKKVKESKNNYMKAIKE